MLFSRTTRFAASATSRISSISSHIQRQQQRNMTITESNSFKLNTGASIPAVGFGIWQDKDSQEEAVSNALKAGVRHIDTAAIYGTEKMVGDAIKKSGIPRSELFITTKLWNNKHVPKDVAPALDASLKDLQTDYVDLYLMHWPSAFKAGDVAIPKKDGKMELEDVSYVDTYKAMEKLLTTGKTKAIGISNFSRAELENLLKETTVVPAAHQIELHPWLQQTEFCDFHKSKGILITQYSPFGNQNEIYDSGKNMGKLMDDLTLVEIGKKYGKMLKGLSRDYKGNYGVISHMLYSLYIGIAGFRRSLLRNVYIKRELSQTALAWGINHGYSVIPKSKTPSRISSNLEGDFKLEAADLKKIDGIDKKVRFNDPSASFGYNFFADLDGKK